MTREVSIKAFGVKEVGSRQTCIITFSDGWKYEFHTAWLIDCHPSVAGSDTYRKDVGAIWKVRDLKISDWRFGEDEKHHQYVEVSIEGRDETESGVQRYDARWLRSIAPYCGRVVEGKEEEVPEVEDTSSLLQKVRERRKAWLAKDVSIPEFAGEELRFDVDTQVKFFEVMEDPGVCVIHGLEAPSSCDDNDGWDSGNPLTDFFKSVVGKMNQHPARKHNFGVMQGPFAPPAESEQTAQANPNVTQDYDQSQPLSMHNDHAIYDGTPGYLQVMYQAEGHVISKVCDGLAILHHLKTHFPKHFDLLSTVKVTHASRNEIYGKSSGNYRCTDKHKQEEAFAFELCHTHPIINLHNDGSFFKMVQSESKRGVCLINFDQFHDFLDAYENFCTLLESDMFVKRVNWPQHSVICVNNYRVLHGRANAHPDHYQPHARRTMCFGYFNKWLVEHRYRYLKMLQAQRCGHFHRQWMVRMPNQLLQRMFESTTDHAIETQSHASLQTNKKPENAVDKEALPLPDTILFSVA